MYCRKCGLEISDDSNSCPFCGEKDLQPHVGPVEPVTPPDKRPDKKLLFLLSALTAALAVACILSFRQVSFLNQQLSDAEAMERALTWENGVVPDAEKPTVEVSTITAIAITGKNRLNGSSWMRMMTASCWSLLRCSIAPVTMMCGRRQAGRPVPFVTGSISRSWKEPLRWGRRILSLNGTAASMTGSSF